VVGNFDIGPVTTTITLPVAGTWYDYLQGGTITATGSAQSINLLAGEYHVYVNRNLVNAVVTPVSNNTAPGLKLTAKVFPNPLNPASVLEVELPQAGRLEAILINDLGQVVSNVFSEQLVRGKHHISIGDKLNILPHGTYMLKIISNNQSSVIKISIR
jgi:hypothetical protein